MACPPDWAAFVLALIYLYPGCDPNTRTIAGTDSATTVPPQTSSETTIAQLPPLSPISPPSPLLSSTPSIRPVIPSPDRPVQVLACNPIPPPAKSPPLLPLPLSPSLPLPPSLLPSLTWPIRPVLPSPDRPMQVLARNPIHHRPNHLPYFHHHPHHHCYPY